MSNKIVQLENEAGDNIYPLAGGALTGSISKTMLEEGVFEGPELSEPSSVAYVATDNIQDGAVTSDKIDFTTYDWTDAGGAVSLHAFGKIVTVTLRVAGFSTDPTIGASDSSPLQITTLPIAPIETIVGSTNCMTAANVNVPDIFFEVSTSGILRLRNYSNTAKTIHRVFANFSFMAAQ